MVMGWSGGLEGSHEGGHEIEMMVQWKARAPTCWSSYGRTEMAGCVVPFPGEQRNKLLKNGD